MADKKAKDQSAQRKAKVEQGHQCDSSIHHDDSAGVNTLAQAGVLTQGFLNSPMTETSEPTRPFNQRSITKVRGIHDYQVHIPRDDPFRREFDTMDPQPSYNTATLRDMSRQSYFDHVDLDDEKFDRDIVRSVVRNTVRQPATLVTDDEGKYYNTEKHLSMPFPKGANTRAVAKPKSKAKRKQSFDTKGDAKGSKKAKKQAAPHYTEEARRMFGNRNGKQIDDSSGFNDLRRNPATAADYEYHSDAETEIGGDEFSFIGEDATFSNDGEVIPQGMVMNAEGKLVNANGRVKGRTLVLWHKPRMFEKVLLHLVYELNRRGIVIPYAQVVHRLSPGSSGASLQQSLNKLRDIMTAEGHLIPPLSGKLSLPLSQSEVNIRGHIRDINSDDPFKTRIVGWDENIKDLTTSLQAQGLVRGSGNHKKYVGGLGMGRHFRYKREAAQARLEAEAAAKGITVEKLRRSRNPDVEFAGGLVSKRPKVRATKRRSNMLEDADGEDYQPNAKKIKTENCYETRTKTGKLTTRSYADIVSDTFVENKVDEDNQSLDNMNHGLQPIPNGLYKNDRSYGMNTVVSAYSNDTWNHNKQAGVHRQPSSPGHGYDVPNLSAPKARTSSRFPFSRFDGCSQAQENPFRTGEFSMGETPLPQSKYAVHAPFKGMHQVDGGVTKNNFEHTPGHLYGHNDAAASMFGGNATAYTGLKNFAGPSTPTLGAMPMSTNEPFNMTRTPFSPYKENIVKYDVDGGTLIATPEPGQWLRGGKDQFSMNFSPQSPLQVNMSMLDAAHDQRPRDVESPFQNSFTIGEFPNNHVHSNLYTPVQTSHMNDGWSGHAIQEPNYDMRPVQRAFSPFRYNDLNNVVRHNQGGPRYVGAHSRHNMAFHRQFAMVDGLVSVARQDSVVNPMGYEFDQNQNLAGIGSGFHNGVNLGVDGAREMTSYPRFLEDLSPVGSMAGVPMFDLTNEGSQLLPPLGGYSPRLGRVERPFFPRLSEIVEDAEIPDDPIDVDRHDDRRLATVYEDENEDNFVEEIDGAIIDNAMHIVLSHEANFDEEDDDDGSDDSSEWLQIDHDEVEDSA